MNHRRHLWVFVAFALSAAGFEGCKEKNPAEPVEEEHSPATTVLIKLVRLDAQGAATSETVEALVRDTTRIKGKPQTEGTLAMKSGAAYAGTVSLLNESVVPPEDITEEIEEEATSHQFVFTPRGGVAQRILISDLDKDKNGRDLGLNFRLTVAGVGAATGTLNVLLRHWDSGNKLDPQYDTDINVDFPVAIED